jgi:hypothetical protein
MNTRNKNFFNSKKLIKFKINFRFQVKINSN